MLLFHRHVTILGGVAADGACAGAFFWNLNNDSGNLNRNIGRQLAGTSVVKLSRKSSVHTQIVSPAVRSKAIETHGAHQQ